MPLVCVSRPGDHSTHCRSVTPLVTNAVWRGFWGVDCARMGRIGDVLGAIRGYGPSPSPTAPTLCAPRCRDVCFWSENRPLPDSLNLLRAIEHGVEHATRYSYSLIAIQGVEFVHVSIRLAADNGHPVKKGEI